MVVNAISPCSFGARHYSKRNVNKVHNESEQVRENSGSKTTGYVIAAALSAAVLTGACLRGHYKSKMAEAAEAAQRTLKRQQEQAQSEINQWKNVDYYDDFRQQKDINSKLQSQVECLSNERDALSTSLEGLNKRLAELLEGDSTPKEAREIIINELKRKIAKGELSYDISRQPIVSTEGKNIRWELPLHVQTSNRAGMKSLYIPEIAKDGSFVLRIPKTDAIKVTHESKSFRSVKNKESSIAISYGKSVNWDSDKIARDLLQNFYDGHGQTLDGVNMIFTPVGQGRYKVRIEGQSTFTPDKAIYLGLSSKQFNTKAAGNYGEGIKMASLKLLTDAGAKDVRIASDNWLCRWTIGQSELLTDEGEKVMCYSVDKLPQRIEGNYIEFETDSMDLLQSLRKSVNRFYHSSNKDFECPQFENDFLGIKMLPNSDRGAIYIAGQRFEFNGDYDGLKGVSIFLKDKLPKNVVDESRDRTSLNTTDLKNIAEYIAGKNDIVFEDKLKILKSLDKYWSKKNKNTPMDDFMEQFVYKLGTKYNFIGNSNIRFPSHFIAYSNASADLVRDLQTKGYIICKEQFKELGMQTIHEFMQNARAHEIVVPTDIQKKKIVILREAISRLETALSKNKFTPDEIDTHIYVFNRNAEREKKLYEDTNAEAIIENGVSKGFWIDKEYLDNATFTDALETALHELSHKVGGDGNADFSYKLTDVNSDTINQIMTNPVTRTELSALQSLWNNLNYIMAGM